MSSTSATAAKAVLRGLRTALQKLAPLISVRRAWIAGFIAAAIGIYGQTLAGTNNFFGQQLSRQEQIRNSTERVAAQLSAILDEFEQNGLAGEDVRRLQLIRHVLVSLSAEDMQMVLRALQSAQQAPNRAQGVNEALSAYAGQKTVSTKFKAVIGEYLELSELYELAHRLREFSQRETALMWRTVRLAQEAKQQLSETQQGDLRLLQIDQTPIKEELMPWLGKLEALTNHTAAGSAAIRQLKEGELRGSLDAAAAALREGRLHAAAGEQRRARNELRTIARLLVQAGGSAAVLRRALAELDQVSDGQTRLIAQVETRASRMDQAELVDATDLVRSDISGIAPIAANHLALASEKMTEARELIAMGKESKAALARQNEAFLAVKRAQRALEDQLRIPEVSIKPEDVMAELERARREIAELIREQTILKDATAAATKKSDLANNASAQGDLKDRTQSLQQRVSSASGKAAGLIGDAALQMHKARMSLAASQNNALAQQAAIDALKQADQQLAEELGRMEQAKKESEFFEELRGRLVALIEAQQKLQLTTARTQNESLPELAGAQANIGSDTARLRTEASSRAPVAASRLGVASTYMQKAEKALRCRERSGAQSQQTEALRELYAARDEIDRTTQPSQINTNAMSLAEAASRMGEAQRQVEGALAELQRQFPEFVQVAQALSNAGEAIAPLAAGEMRELPPAAQSALESAQAATASGAGQAASGQGSAAQSSAQAAAEALAQAQSAMALAQAGLKSKQIASGQSGQGQGKGQMTGQGQNAGQSSGKSEGKGDGRTGNWAGTGGADGPRGGALGQGKFTGLPRRDRAALIQSQGEKYPREYAPLVEQYLKNLADQTGQRK